MSDEYNANTDTNHDDSHTGTHDDHDEIYDNPVVRKIPAKKGVRIINAHRAKADKISQARNILMAVFSAGILIYSFYAGMLLWGIIVILMFAIPLLVLSSFIKGVMTTSAHRAKADKRSQARDISMIVFGFGILMYSFYVGMLLWGIIAVVMLAMLFLVLHLSP